MMTFGFTLNMVASRCLLRLSLLPLCPRDSQLRQRFRRTNTAPPFSACASFALLVHAMSQPCVQSPHSIAAIVQLVADDS